MPRERARRSALLKGGGVLVDANIGVALEHAVVDRRSRRRGDGQRLCAHDTGDCGEEDNRELHVEPEEEV